MNSNEKNFNIIAENSAIANNYLPSFRHIKFNMILRDMQAAQLSSVHKLFKPNNNTVV